MSGYSYTRLSGTGQSIAFTIRDNREKEKRQMADLNDRLANYIEKVRFLEAQNRKITHDLEALKLRWGSETTSVEVMCDSEIKTSQSIIDDCNRQREILESETRRLISDLSEVQKKYEEALKQREGSRTEIDSLLKKLAEIESLINLIKRRILIVEEEITRIKRENQRLLGELSCNKKVFEKESATKADYQRNVHDLLNECDILGRQQTTEMNELVVRAHRDTTPENREYFRNELSMAIKEIRGEYEKISFATKHDMESWYKKMVSEIQNQSKNACLEDYSAREEIKKYRTTLNDMRSKLSELEGKNLMLEKQIQELNFTLEDENRAFEAALGERDENIRVLRDECQALMVELQMLLDTKTSLDAEIAIYRKMLEGEENRTGLRQLVDLVVRGDSVPTLAFGSQNRKIISSELLRGSTTTRILSSSQL